ncbi:high-affinity nitrate transporter [Salix suchowensis]|uniref:High-affinity nitrate transporter n=1 Tax=Salix koriyanagi TaxID=2511006 RepID=A0A9Q0SSA9_9ROSI|nr:high-affinity nitrate transporter [Salix suchowensis]KAJ6688249.1 HIGH-AFFINITY NITRATE TRANSPORTER 3.2 [Salix koriyanagi]
MATARALLVASLVLSCFLFPCYGTVLFSSLQRTLEVTASPTSQQVLKAGVDKITVTWGVNQTLPAGTDSSYKTIKVKLCYARISQVDRPWRKTVDLLKKDRTCQHKVAARPYNPANRTSQSLDWTVARDVPTATYFIRAYAYDADDKEVAFGQTTDANKTTNLFQVQAISGRHATIDICSICFSVFSVVSLFGFFYNEKRKAH